MRTIQHCSNVWKMLILNGEITWKEHLAELNALVDAMEEAWKKKNSH
jgi:hypothetical protein